MTENKRRIANFNFGPSGRKRLPVSESELESCCLEGLSPKQAQIRLVRCGVVLSERTVGRRMSEWRARQHQNRALQQVGIGIGSVYADLAAVTATMQTAAPEWKQRHVADLKAEFERFVNEPTSERFTAVVVHSYTLLISSNLQALFGGEGA